MQIHSDVCQVTNDFFLGSGWSDRQGARYCFIQKEKDLARPVDELTVSRNEELDQES